MKHLQSVWQLSCSDIVLAGRRGLLGDGMGDGDLHTRKAFFCYSMHAYDTWRLNLNAVNPRLPGIRTAQP